MMRMQKRLDIIIAFNNEEKEQKSLERELKMDELVDSIGQRLGSIKEAIQSAPGAYVDNVRDEIADLRARYDLYMESRKNYKETLDFYKRDMIRNNPGMNSEKYQDSFEELKNAVTDKNG